MAGCTRCGGAFLGPTLSESRSGICDRCQDEAAKQSRAAQIAERDRVESRMRDDGDASGHGVVRPCQRCGHEVLVKCAFADRAPGREEGAPAIAQPLAIGFRTKQTTGWRTGGVTADTESPFGLLEGYFCRSCGFVVWFVRSPEKVPIGVEFGTELIDLRGSGKPFR